MRHLTWNPLEGTHQKYKHVWVRNIILRIEFDKLNPIACDYYYSQNVYILSSSEIWINCMYITCIVLKGIAKNTVLENSPKIKQKSHLMFLSNFFLILIFGNVINIYITYCL